ncbi:synaptic vesicle glycoprotein 2B-like [Aphomia sociella]
MTAKSNKAVPFESALTMTGFSRFNYLVILLCSSIIAAMSFEAFSVSYLVPASACELGTVSSEQGLMAAIPIIGIIATSYIWGYLADTRGRKKILLFAMMFSYVTGALAALSPNWIVFSVLKLCSSSAVSGGFALTITLLGECTPVAQRSTVIMFTTSVFLACTGIMAAIAIPVLPLTFSYYIPVLDIHFNSWRLLNLIFNIPCVISFVGLLFAYESPRYLLSSGDQVGSLKTLRKIYVINNGKDGDSYQVDSVVLEEDSSTKNNNGFWASMAAQTVPLLKPPLLFNTILLAALFVTVYMCINPFIVWMPYIADAVLRTIEVGADGMTFCDMIRFAKNITVSQAAETGSCVMNTTAMTLVFATGILLGVLNILLSALINVVGRRRLLIFLELVAGTAALCLNVSHIWILSTVLFITFISGNLNFGILSTFSVDLFPTYVKAMAVSLTLMVGRGSAFFGINIVKYLIDSHCETTFYIFGSITFLGGIVALLLPLDVKKPKQADSVQKLT